MDFWPASGDAVRLEEVAVSGPGFTTVPTC